MATVAGTGIQGGSIPVRMDDDRRIEEWRLVRRAQGRRRVRFRGPLPGKRAQECSGSASGMSSDPTLAEELTQDVFVRAWQKLSSFRGRERLLLLALPAGRQRGPLGAAVAAAADDREFSTDDLTPFERPEKTAGPDTGFDLERARHPASRGAGGVRAPRRGRLQATEIAHMREWRWARRRRSSTAPGSCCGRRSSHDVQRSADRLDDYVDGLLTEGEFQEVAHTSPPARPAARRSASSARSWPRPARCPASRTPPRDLWTGMPERIVAGGRGRLARQARTSASGPGGGRGGGGDRLPVEHGGGTPEATRVRAGHAARATGHVDSAPRSRTTRTPPPSSWPRSRERRRLALAGDARERREQPGRDRPGLDEMRAAWPGPGQPRADPHAGVDPSQEGGHPPPRGAALASDALRTRRTSRKEDEPWAGD